MTVCQSKCDSSSMNASNEVFHPRHFLGRLLINIKEFISSSSEIAAKSDALGKNSRKSPLEFSLVPLCQEEYGSAK